MYRQSAGSLPSKRLPALEPMNIASSEPGREEVEICRRMARLEIDDHDLSRLSLQLIVNALVAFDLADENGIRFSLLEMDLLLLNARFGTRA